MRQNCGNEQRVTHVIAKTTVRDDGGGDLMVMMVLMIVMLMLMMMVMMTMTTMVAVDDHDAHAGDDVGACVDDACDDVED